MSNEISWMQCKYMMQHMLQIFICNEPTGIHNCVVFEDSSNMAFCHYFHRYWCNFNQNCDSNQFVLPGVPCRLRFHVIM